MCKYFKLLAILSSLLTSFSVEAFDIAVTDSNLAKCIQQLAEKNNWQTPADVVALECHNQNITTLDGIEQFSNLQNLSVYNNAITEIAILRLPKLQQLNIAKNKLTKLNLIGLPELELLLAFGNQLKTLDLTDLPKLKTLKANNNQITVFTYANLPSLEKLYLFDNKMPTIDIYHLPKMNYMDVRQSPMPDKLYEEMDKLKGVTFLHNGNSRDWQ